MWPNPQVYLQGITYNNVLIEAAFQRCSSEKVVWKYTENLQDNNHAKVRFQ